MMKNSVLFKFLRTESNLFLVVCYIGIGVVTDLFLLSFPVVIYYLFEINQFNAWIFCLFVGMIAMRLLLAHFQKKLDIKLFSYRYLQIPVIGEKILNQSIEFIDSYAGKNKIEQAYQAIYQGGNAGIEFYCKQWINLMRYFLDILIIFIISVKYMNGYFLLAVLGLTIASSGVKVYFKNRMKELQKQDSVRRLEERYLTKTFLDTLSQRELRLFQMRPWFESKINKTLQAKKHYIQKANQVELVLSVVNTVILGLYIVIIYFACLQLVELNGVAWHLYLVVLLLLQLQVYAQNFHNTVQAILSNVKYIQDWVNFMESEESESHHFASCPAVIETIEFKNIVYQNPESNATILNNISFTLRRGESTALLGLNGSGKTTLIKLLVGLLKPTSGTILVNGEEKELYQNKNWYAQMGVTFQENSLFEGAIAENIVCGQEIDDAKIMKSLAQVGLSDFVESKQAGYHTYIGNELNKEGILLSGGETQRLQIARMLYKPHQVAILDEPTASMDPINEFKFYHLLTEHVKDKISIFVSHRIGSTDFCDQIMILTNGEIEAKGTPAELAANSVTYQAMIEAYRYYMYEKEGESDA